MSNMFKDSEINNLILSNFNTSNVYSMDFMFFGIKTDSLDLSSFNIENVSDI